MDIFNDGDSEFGTYLVKLFDGRIIETVDTRCDPTIVEVLRFNKNPDQSRAFEDCYALIKVCTLPEGIVNFNNTFAGCQRLNQSFVLPSTVDSAAGMFRDCKALNSPVIFNEGIRTIYSCFTDCAEFNKPVVIPESVIDAKHLFSDCYSFNQPTRVPEKCSSLDWMFHRCHWFNSTVTIEGNQKSGAGMFFECTLFNQSVDLKPFFRIEGMLKGCVQFNQPLELSKPQHLHAEFLQGCIEFRGPITINVDNYTLQEMNIGSNIGCPSIRNAEYPLEEVHIKQRYVMNERFMRSLSDTVQTLSGEIDDADYINNITNLEELIRYTKLRTKDERCS